MTTPHAPIRFAGMATACRTRRLRLCLTLLVVVIPIDGVIDLGLAPFVERTLTEASTQEAAAEGIDSLSLNPDSQIKTMLAIVDLETRLAQGAPESAGVRAQAGQ